MINDQQKNIEIKEIEKEFIKTLHAYNYKFINDTSDLLKLKKLDKELQEIILLWIPEINNKFHSQEMLVRALAVAEKPFDGSILINLFDDAKSTSTFRWAIANTIASGKAENISDWLEKKLTNKDQPIENQMLVYAAQKYFEKNKAEEIIKRLFDKHPLQVIDALTYFKNVDDVDFLESKVKGQTKLIQKNINKAIKKISSY